MSPSPRIQLLLLLSCMTAVAVSMWRADGAPVRALRSAMRVCRRSNCCMPPPADGKIYAWKPNPKDVLKVRRPLHEAFADKTYKAKYLEAYKRLRALPATDPRSWDQQMAVHCAYCSARVFGMDIHRSWLFFPWHRMFLYFHERILAKLINDPTFALPYWAWDNIAGRTVDLEFLNPKATIYRKARNPYFNSLQSQISYGCDPANVQNAMIDTADTYDFIGYPYGQGRGGRVELSMHGNIHVAIGQQNYPWSEMGNLDTAAQDPLFYLHHCNIDRFWWLWRKLPEDPNGRKRTDPGEANFLDSSFLFYDENSKLMNIRVRDVVNHIFMRFTYKDIPLDWIPGDVDVGKHPYETSKRRRHLLSAEDDDNDENYDASDFDPDTFDEDHYNRRLLNEEEEPTRWHSGRHYRRGNWNRTSSWNFSDHNIAVKHYHYHYHLCENGSTYDQEKAAEAMWRSNQAKEARDHGASPPPSKASGMSMPDSPETGYSPSTSTPPQSPPATRSYIIGSTPITVKVSREPPERRQGYVRTTWDKNRNCLKKGQRNMEALVVEGFYLFKDRPLTFNVFVDNPYADVSTSLRRNTGFIGSHTHVPMGMDNMKPSMKEDLVFPMQMFLEREDKLDVLEITVTFVGIEFKPETGVRMACPEQMATFTNLKIEYK